MSTTQSGGMGRGSEGRSCDLTRRGPRVPAVVLFDIMCEAKTRAQGALIGLHEGGLISHDNWLHAASILDEIVDGVRPDDRDAILATTKHLRLYWGRISQVIRG